MPLSRLANSSQELQTQANELFVATKPFDMEINVSKPKIMITTRHETTHQLSP